MPGVLAELIPDPDGLLRYAIAVPPWQGPGHLPIAMGRTPAGWWRLAGMSRPQPALPGNSLLRERASMDAANTSKWQVTIPKP